jgi:hypothetical protein
VGKNFEIIFREFANSETFVMSRALLEDYKVKAAQEERERIIKLLEELHDALTDDYGYTHESIAVSKVIDKIKGETNETM